MSFGGNGKRDWLLQRFSAVVIAAYTFYLFYIFLSSSNLDFVSWHSFNASLCTKIFTLLTILSLCVHAWIGIWTICTDYLKCSCLRLTVLFAVATTLLICFGYNFYTIWSL
jgi:succinate dehydrogenase / fumarate reductase membrane anchor subunit